MLLRDFQALKINIARGKFSMYKGQHKNPANRS
jgi:hypothetical protein